jgi:hypothetical protein
MPFESDVRPITISTQQADHFASTNWPLHRADIVADSLEKICRAIAEKFAAAPT